MCRARPSCLRCVGLGRSDGRHEANPSFHAITKISRILGTLAVLMMGMNKGVKETQYQKCGEVELVRQVHTHFVRSAAAECSLRASSAGKKWKECGRRCVR